MTSDASSARGSGLGDQLRATAHAPEDDAAAQLRARLRQRMFGVRARRALPVPVADPEVAAPHGDGMPWLGWAMPAVAVLGLVAMMVWQRQAAAPSPPAAMPAAVTKIPVVHPPQAPPVADEGPGLLAQADALPPGEARELAVADALAASWAIPASELRLRAASDLATALLRDGHARRSIAAVRAVLDDLELAPRTQAARIQMLRLLPPAYEALGRGEAAASVRTELARLEDAPH